MIEKTALFKVSISVFLSSRRISRSTDIVNANPHHIWPFTDIMMTGGLGEGCIQFSSDLSDDFISREIIPCGRPHLGFSHVALINDAIATTSFQLVTGEQYGQRYRYVELGAIVRNHREAYYQGSVKQLPSQAIFVDGYRIRWQILPSKSWRSMTHRGVVQVALYGLHQFEEVQVASVELEYFRRHGVPKAA